MRSPVTRRNAVATGAIVLIAAIATWYIRSSPRLSATRVPAPALTATAPVAGKAGIRPLPAGAGEPAQSTAARAAVHDSHQWVRSIVDTLIARGDPHSLGAAALLMSSNALDFTDPTDPTENRDAFRSRVASLARRAAAAAPNDAAIQSLALNFCPGTKDCDPSVYENALASIDAANAWTGVAALRRAVQEQDTGKQAEVLARMAHAQRYDGYRDAMEALVSNALQSVSVAPAEDSGWDNVSPLQRLLSNTMAMSPPNDGFAPILKSCGASTPEAVMHDCRVIAKLMSDSQDDSVALTGRELARGLARPGSAEAAQLDEAQRKYDWQMYQAIRLPRSPEQNARFVKGRLGDPQLRRELLQENGIPLEPPADWTSPPRPAQ
jgi:hypothetical protein